MKKYIYVQVKGDLKIDSKILQVLSQNLLDLVFWIPKDLVEKILKPRIDKDTDKQKQKMKSQGGIKMGKILSFNKIGNGCVLDKSRKISIIEVV